MFLGNRALYDASVRTVLAICYLGWWSAAHRDDRAYRRSDHQCNQPRRCVSTYGGMSYRPQMERRSGGSARGQRSGCTTRERRELIGSDRHHRSRRYHRSWRANDVSGYATQDQGTHSSDRAAIKRVRNLRSPRWNVLLAGGVTTSSAHIFLRHGVGWSGRVEGVLRPVSATGIEFVAHWMMADGE